MHINLSTTTLFIGDFMKQKLLLISFLLFSFSQTVQGLSNHALGFLEGLAVNSLLTKYGASGKLLTCTAIGMLAVQRFIYEEPQKKGTGKSWESCLRQGFEEKLKGAFTATALYYVGLRMTKKYIDMKGANYIPHYMGLTIFTMLLNRRTRLIN